MDIPVYTRSGHLNNNGRESDALYPFDWSIGLAYLNDSRRLTVALL
jgi:hypothetical protein